MDLQLKGLRVLVTGASRGLGYATALVLAQEGAEVAINSRTAENIQKAAQIISEQTGARVHSLAGDVLDPDTPARLVAEAAELMDGLDILVTNSGGPPPGSFESLTDQDWQRAIDLNLMSHIRLIRSALPHLRRSSAPSVLTVTSYSVKQPIPNLVLSNSIRAATVGLTKTLALELGHESIRFNSILPGWTSTERVHELMSARAKISGASIEEEIARQSKDSPLGRMGKPHEFAQAAAFLVSPAASYITGVMLTVEGGMYKGIL
jgi:3-oxoacyl-[acyl-carrier protein] reductase